tara:strand:- start:165 stop:371 length:207 start_codon:yes stop_codon:yes gene_type:complete
MVVYLLSFSTLSFLLSYFSISLYFLRLKADYTLDLIDLLFGSIIEFSFLREDKGFTHLNYVIVGEIGF